MMIRAKIAQLAKLAAAFAVPLACTLPARADSGWGLLNMTPGVTEISRNIYALHMEIFWICVVIAAAPSSTRLLNCWSNARGSSPRS